MKLKNLTQQQFHYVCHARLIFTAFELGLLPPPHVCLEIYSLHAIFCAVFTFVYLGFLHIFERIRLGNQKSCVKWEKMREIKWKSRCKQEKHWENMGTHTTHLNPSGLQAFVFIRVYFQLQWQLLWLHCHRHCRCRCDCLCLRGPEEGCRMKKRINVNK